MVIGLGVDIFDVDRVEAKLRTQDAAFLAQIFTEDEVADCAAQRHPAAHYAARFAAKEALLKALSTPHDDDLPLSWRDIAIARRADGRDDVHLHGPIRALAERRGVTRILLSMSLAHRVALACVVLEADP
jgi:holo-[acyl-carrier protein] synthase